MHSYKGKDNHVYHFDGDCSGDLIITEIEGSEIKKEIRVDFKDIMDIINEKSHSFKVVETGKMVESIVSLQQYIDKKITNSIGREDYSNIELQEILEEIDSKLDNVKKLWKEE